MKKILVNIILISMALCSCSTKPDIKSHLDEYPEIFPDYTDVTVPQNIAPLNFVVTDEHAEGKVMLLVESNGKPIVSKLERIWSHLECAFGAY